MSASIPPRPPGLSRSLGSDDPRHRRQGEQPSFSKFFQLDKNGQIVPRVSPPLYLEAGQIALNLEELIKKISFEEETDIAGALILEDGKIKVRPAEGVDNLPTVGATLADVVDKVNELLNSLRNNEFLG